MLQQMQRTTWAEICSISDIRGIYSWQLDAIKVPDDFSYSWQEEQHHYRTKLFPSFLMVYFFSFQRLCSIVHTLYRYRDVRFMSRNIYLPWQLSEYIFCDIEKKQLIIQVECRSTNDLNDGKFSMKKTIEICAAPIYKTKYNSKPWLF